MVVPRVEHYEVSVPHCGKLDVFVHGKRGPNEMVILTMHDLGCSYNELLEFLSSSSMANLVSRLVWAHVVAPGQLECAFDLPPEYKYPTLQDIAEDIPVILSEMKFGSVVLFGDGVGSNILLRTLFLQDNRVLGAILHKATVSSAGFLEARRDKAVGRKLSKALMSSSTEQALVYHRFGLNGSPKTIRLEAAVSKFKEYLRGQSNQRNLACYNNAYMERTPLLKQLNRISVPVLLAIAHDSDHAHECSLVHSQIQHAFKDDFARRRLVELVRVNGCCSLLHEMPEKFAECIYYYLQGLGVLCSVPAPRPVSSPQPPARAQQIIKQASKIDEEENQKPAFALVRHFGPSIEPLLAGPCCEYMSDTANSFSANSSATSTSAEQLANQLHNAVQLGPHLPTIHEVNSSVNFNSVNSPSELASELIPKKDSNSDSDAQIKSDGEGGFRRYGITFGPGVRVIAPVESSTPGTGTGNGVGGSAFSAGSLGRTTGSASMMGRRPMTRRISMQEMDQPRGIQSFKAYVNNQESAPDAPGRVRAMGTNGTRISISDSGNES